MIKTNIKMRVTAEQIGRVQEICFSNGIYWADTGDNYIEHNMFVGVYLEHKTLWGVLSIAMLNDVEYKEISADLFIKTNGTCEEITNSAEDRYCKSIINFAKVSKESDNILLKKKIENLHIALNKKVERNKNQALEITKLLDQKKDLQDKLNQANRIVKIGIDNASKLVNFLDEKDEIIKAQDNDVRMLESNLRIRNEYVSIVDEKVKELENRLKQLNSSGVTTNDTMSNYVDDLHTKLKEKDTIISYLESKLK